MSYHLKFRDDALIKIALWSCLPDFNLFFQVTLIDQNKDRKSWLRDLPGPGDANVYFDYSIIVIGDDHL